MTSPLLAKTIPTQFIRLDATMSDADAYNNVRDLQVRLENHNMLLARRVRQPIFTLQFRDNDDARSPMLFRALGTMSDLSLTPPNPALLFRVPIWVPPWCQACELVGWVHGESGAVKCYGKIDSPTHLTNPPSAATFTAPEPEARVSGEVLVPQDAAQQGMALFSFYIDGVIGGSDLKGTGTVEVRDVGVEAGRPFIDADFGGGQDGNAIYIEGKLYIHPRLCTSSYNIGTGALNGTGDTYRCYLDQPFNINPVPGTDFANSRSVRGVNIYSLSLWPKAISNFDAGVDLP